MLKQRPRDESIDRAEIHDVLSNDRRWQVLELLSDEDPRDLRSLANDIAAAESSESPAPRQIRQSVYVTLHQNHLPKLDSLDIVEYDDTSKLVALGDRADEIDGYLDVVEREHLSGDEYQLGIVVLGLVTTLASAIGAPILATLQPVTYAATALVLLLVAMTLQMRQ